MDKVSIGKNRLAGVFAKSETPRCVALLVNGLTGDKDQKGRFVELQQELTKRDVASLRFDPRGRGETPGGYLTPLTFAEDVAEAAQWLNSQCPDVPGVVVARGEGAYASLVSLGASDVWGYIVFWAAILFPRASRELQGDYHTFREEGQAILRLPDGSSVTFTKEYFDTLERLPSVYDGLRPELRITFIHSPKDEIAPLAHVQDFCGKAKVASTGVIPPGLVGHMHHESEYIDDYIRITLHLLDLCRP